MTTTFLPTSLTARFALIAAQEAEWIEQGYCVGTLVKDEAHWNAFGIFTADDFDDEMALEAAKEDRKAAMWGDDDRDYFAEQYEADMAADSAAYHASLPETYGDYRTIPELEETTFYRICGHYQAGWN